MFGIVLKINENGDLEDSYTIAVNQNNDFLECKSAIFFNDGSYIVSWLSMSSINLYGVNPNSILYKTLNTIQKKLNKYNNKMIVSGWFAKFINVIDSFIELKESACVWGCEHDLLQCPLYTK